LLSFGVLATMSGVSCSYASRVVGCDGDAADELHVVSPFEKDA